MNRRVSNSSLQDELDFIDDEEDQYEDYGNSSSNNGAAADSGLVVEKILGRKFSMNDDTKLMEELYYIKWKNSSYLHASWERREDVEEVDPNGKTKIKRFLMTPLPANILGELEPKHTTKIEGLGNEEIIDFAAEDEEVEYFNPELVEVQRIISCDTAECSHSKARKPEDLLKEKPSKKRKAESDSADGSDDPENEVKYLVKWRGLSYADCTWERFEDIKSYYQEVWYFWQIQKPPKLPLNCNPNPTLQEYKKLETSPIFGLSKLFPEENSYDEGLRLRDYQLEGVNWLLWNWWHKRSCILADEMGLGKTIQTITFLHQLRYMPTTGIRGPFLIIAPLSLVDQWQSEIATWSPDMNCVLLHGSVTARETIINNEFYFQEPFVTKQDASALKKASVCKFHILLTTYEVATKEIRNLCRVPWQVMIIDEAHKLKNTSSKVFSTLSTIESDHRILLTGTPLQNKTEELWSLLNFADPKRFSEMKDFMGKFGDLKSAAQVANLHEVLKPYLLRRIKEDVERSLPPKEETIVEVALTAVQKRFYRAIYERNTVYLFKGLKASNQPSLMNVMMELRKCCNHPFLVRGVEERVFSELTPEEKVDHDIVHKKLIESSGKLVLLDKLLPRLQKEGHKVLIFSQMVRVLNLLEDFLKYKGYSFERLDGSSKSSDRKEAVERFCKPSLNRFIMLLSTKAGGLGLNLTAADTVIIFDSDWNPQNDLQAQARAHRIGQTKSVMVYRLLTRKTYEMEMFHQASMKLGLDRAVLAHARNEQDEEQAGKTNKPNQDPGKFNMKEIDELLKRGAYDVFREDDTDQNEFVEADIDAIMQRRTHKVVYDEAAGSITSTLGNFSKASFVSADEKEDVDINDPDFWKKAIGLKQEATGDLADPDEDEILPQQRVRKQTKVYGDQQQLDEAQLKLLLKPLKAPKPEKAAKQTQKQLQKEALAKEKQLREEAKKAKLAEEMKMKADPKNWGPHSRDRVLRSLNMYGFGRWERIKNETSKGMMETNNLESFCKAYVIQCGLIAAEQENLKSDTPFLLDAIQAAKHIDARMKAGEIFEIPPTLQDDKFLSKLKAGGTARKCMNKLDTLSKLKNMIFTAIDGALKAKKVDYDPNTDIDILFGLLTVADITPFIPLGDIRPGWARTCSWWNLECDKHLLIGIFKHGFGRYDTVKDDETLLFRNKLKELADTYAAAAAKDEEGMQKDGVSTDELGSPNGIGASNSTGEMKMDVIESNEDSKDGLTSAPTPSLPNVESKMTLDELGRDDDLVEDRGDDGDDRMDDMDDDDLGGVSMKTTNGIGLPDPRHLNRLITWLVSADMARMTELDLVDKKRERKSKNSTAKDEPGKKTPVPVPVKPSFVGEFITAERESSLFSALREAFDLDTISLVYKVQIQGLKKCEQFLALAVPVELEETPTEEENELQSPMNVEEGHLNANSQDQNSNSPQEPVNTISEFESIRLCATLILHGAPLQGIDNLAPIIERYTPLMGLKSRQNDVKEGSTLNRIFGWSDVIRISGLMKLSERDCEGFYQDVWLRFCESIIKTKVLSYAQNKFVVPNPLLETSDHHFAAKGLCQIFAIRQQLLYATYFVLNNCEEFLFEYLRNPIGRSVDNMPVWWCPWIHDVGLLIGMLKYGFLSLEEIFQDPDLPFSSEYLEGFIKRVFIYGPGKKPQVQQQTPMEQQDGSSSQPLSQQSPAPSHGSPSHGFTPINPHQNHHGHNSNPYHQYQAPLGSYDLTNSEDADQFVKYLLLQSPDPRDLELRVIKILEEITKLLPDEHACKIVMSNQMFRQLLIHNGSLTDYETTTDSKGKVDSRNCNRSTARPPAVSLKAFQQTSRKRRRLYVASYHPEFQHLIPISHQPQQPLQPQQQAQQQSATTQPLQQHHSSSFLINL